MTRFPESGTSWSELKSHMEEIRRADVDWRRGRAPLHVYYAGADVMDVGHRAFVMFMEANALAPGAFPSVAKMEREVIEATLELLNAPQNAVGSVTSGGTESILLAMKAARDHRCSQQTVRGRLEVILPRSAHPAFDKAAHFLGMKAVRVPLGSDFRADTEQIAAVINDQTVMLVASAPSLPYGVMDPVREIAAIAAERDLWLHVDACIGGFLAPFVRKLGYEVPDFDFRVPGVRSISADLHKYGYAAKGASALLYLSAAFHEYQFSEVSDWPKGMYRTPSMCGTRSGGAIAAAWAVMNYLGKEGYLSLAQRIMGTRRRLFAGIAAIPGLALIGAPPLATFAFTSEDVDIFAVADEMAQTGWYISRLAEPHGIHQMLSLAHEAPVDEYLDDLGRAVERVRKLSLRARDQPVVTY
jgi:glutamate/tyrosine decarboxylase-like PLP-dependent enzyme